jgi:hypothetical protein
VFTYSQARQKLADVLERATAEGEVRIRRRDSVEFTVRSIQGRRSPLDVQGVNAGLSAEETVGFVREVEARPGPVQCHRPGAATRQGRAGQLGR